MLPPDSTPEVPRRRKRRSRAVRPAVDRLESRTVPATFVVNSFIDDLDAHPGDGHAQTADGHTTLRAAIMEANALPGADTIVLPAGTYRLTRLGVANEDTDGKGDLDLFGAVSVQGAGAGQTSIDGLGHSRLFDLHGAGGVSISDVTLTSGSADVGGAIRADGSSDLTLLRTVLRGNQASANGGALAALAGEESGALHIQDCFFQSNSAPSAAGGAIYAGSRELSIDGCTFAGNLAKEGGATAAFGGEWMIARSTFSGNAAPKAGGAIEATELAQLSVSDSTIADNQSLSGGGVYASTAPEVVNTILAGNTAVNGPDFLGLVTSGGFNLIGNASGSAGFGKPGDRLGTNVHPIDPRLLPLSFYGGLTPTRLPLPDSPAIDAGTSLGGTDRRNIDQRGILRPATGADIGAVEARTFTLSRLSGVTSAAVATAYAPLRVQFREGDMPVPGVVVTFTAPAVGPSGTFAGPAAVITDANGIATAPTFTANSIPGNFAVRAAIAGGIFLDFPLTNLHGPVASLDVTAPSIARAGDSAELSLTVRDGFGNVIDDFAGRVFVSCTDANATLPAFVDFAPSDHGSKSLTVQWHTAGPQSVTFTGNGIHASANFTINPGVAATLDVTSPTSTRAGDALSLHLTMHDAFGNVATDFTGPITVTSSDPRATLPTNLQFTAADRGEKNMSLTLRTAGTAGVTIASGGLTSTANIEVTAAAAVRLELSGPSTVRAGDSFVLVATARDAFGNVATGFAGRATLLSNDPNSTLPTSDSFTPNDAGVHLFQLTFRTAGARSVTLGAGGLTQTFSTTATPGAVNHFTLNAPTAIDEAAPFALTVTAFDAFGNIATDYTGTVSLSSDDPRAELPPAAIFTTGDAGVHTFSGLTLHSPGNDTVHVADAGNGVSADVSIAVNNLGPRDLTLTTSASNLNEGETLNLGGSFSNIDPTDTHSVVIHWGDGSADTTLDLAAGVTSFSTTHTFADDADAAIHVTVTDSQSAAISADASVTVTNVAPTIDLPTSNGPVIDRVGDLISMAGSFSDPGSDTWHASVDFGDGSGAQGVALDAEHGFTLRHVYTAEGTFTVLLQLTDDDGGTATFTERVAVLLPGTGAVKIIEIGPGETGHINTNTYDVEFQNASQTDPAVFLAALVDSSTLAQLPDSPTSDANAKVIVVDFRALDADPGSKLTIKLHYDPTGVPPELKFFNADTGKFDFAKGSALFANSFVIDKANHTVTITIDGSTSFPTLSRLKGTIFTLTVPTPPAPTPTPTPTPSTQLAFFVAPNAVPNGASDASAFRATANTTALSAGGELTLTLASSDSLRRGGGDNDTSGSPRLPAVLQFMHDLFEMRQVIYEAFRMWLEHPAPIMAPALLPPPPVDQLETWQIKLDAPAPELREDAPIDLNPIARPAAKFAAAGPVELTAESPSIMIDATDAVASRKPWWLADAAPAAPTPSTVDDPIAVPQVTSEPSSDERTMAALAGLWIGGHALAISAPHTPEEEEPTDPRRTKLKLRGRPEEE